MARSTACCSADRSWEAARYVAWNEPRLERGGQTARRARGTRGDTCRPSVARDGYAGLEEAVMSTTEHEAAVEQTATPTPTERFASFFGARSEGHTSELQSHS